MRVLAPAKLNLGLRIVGRRADGLHRLESVFVPLDLADELDVRAEEAARPEVALALDGSAEGVPAGERNLAARAAHAFLAASGRRVRVEIGLRKSVPAAAGLGGGSSDAGAVLRALAARFPGALPAHALAKLAEELGADVPFFLDPRPALVHGIGERREPLPGRLPALPVLLANPGEPLATAAVFAAHAASRQPPAAAGGLAPRWRTALAGSPAGLVERLAPLLENDLEPAAERLCPPLGPLREALGEAGAGAVGLSGSGATLYGLFPTAAAASAALGRLALPAGAWARLASTLEPG
jgi:4-diphosphocytidyl-2-C-methyl-D-erythritol kinase